MLRVLDALQFIQQQFQIGLRNYKVFDAVFNRIVVFANILIYKQISGAVVVVKTLCNQQRPLSKIAEETTLFPLVDKLVPALSATVVGIAVTVIGLEELPTNLRFYAR